jgi:NADH:ubiquinone oxidoreductase subunit
MDLLDRINLKLNYNKVGEDIYGNRYHESKKEVRGGVKRRVVMYKNAVEPTCIPPMWHAWIHYLKDDIPSVEECQTYSWQKEYSPNLTGVKDESPALGVRNKVSADYSAWKVNK